MDFRTLKRSLDEVFSRMQLAAEAGELPEQADVDQFMRLARLMLTQARDEWAGEAEDFAQLAQQLVQAVKKRHREDAVMLVESLDDARQYCHRSFQGPESDD